MDHKAMEYHLETLYVVKMIHDRQMNRFRAEAPEPAAEADVIAFARFLGEEKINRLMRGYSLSIRDENNNRFLIIRAATPWDAVAAVTQRYAGRARISWQDRFIFDREREITLWRRPYRWQKSSVITGSATYNVQTGA